MMRITTRGSLYTYQNNLMKSTNQLYTAMNRYMSKRNFDSYSTNPAAATRAFKIHSSLNALNAQYANNNTVEKKFSTAWDIADDIINDLSLNLGKVPALGGLNTANISALNTQGEVLESGAEAIIQSLNNKYGDSFIFNGADTQNPPFAIEEENGVSYVTYRGIRIDDPITLAQDYIGADGKTIPKDPNNPGLGNISNEEMLKMWENEEHSYVDIGIGFKMENGEVVESTAFDAAISGTKFLGGAGLDEDGDPKNMVSIMLRLSEIFKGYNEDTKEWTVGSQEEAERLVNKFNAAHEEVSKQHTALETDAKYLQTNATQLENTFDAMDTERESIENIDEVEAILALSWAQTSYNAALQVGANVVPQSLMDYLS